MVLLKLHVIPKAARSQIVGWEGDLLRVRIAAVPEKGKANTAIIALMAEALRISKSRIALLKGETSREKTLSIENMSLEEIKQKIP